jgi:hypothetical protein
VQTNAATMPMRNEWIMVLQECRGM